MLASRLVRPCLALLLLAGASSPAVADAPLPAPPGVLPASKLQVGLTLELQATADKFAKPISLAPDLSYGVTPDLTLSLVHSRFARTGFRAAVGGGLCLTGEDNGCGHVYDAAGVEAAYAVLRGPSALAAVVGLHGMSFDLGAYSAKVGVRYRMLAGKVAVTAMPSVLLGVTNRTATSDHPKNADSLWIPVGASYKASPALQLGLGTGLKGPLDGLGDAWEVPLGANVQYTIDPSLSCGASWVFGALLGGATNPPDPSPAVKGLDPRGLQVWLTYTR